MDSLSGATQPFSVEWASARDPLHSRNRERIENFSRVRFARSPGCKREEPQLAGYALCVSSRTDAARLPNCGVGTARRRGGVAPSTATQPQYPLPHGNTRAIDRDPHARTRSTDDGQWECPLRSLPKVACSHAVWQSGPEHHHLQRHQRAACLSTTISMPTLRESGLFATRGLLHELHRSGVGGGEITRAYRQNGRQIMTNWNLLRRFFNRLTIAGFPSNTSFAIEPPPSNYGPKHLVATAFARQVCRLGYLRHENEENRSARLHPESDIPLARSFKPLASDGTN
jgi:hypothetical protein